jgi:hypothetical protein
MSTTQRNDTAALDLACFCLVKLQVRMAQNTWIVIVFSYFLCIFGNGGVHGLRSPGIERGQQLNLDSGVDVSFGLRDKKRGPCEPFEVLLF